MGSWKITLSGGTACGPRTFLQQAASSRVGRAVRVSPRTRPYLGSPRNQKPFSITNLHSSLNAQILYRSTAWCDHQKQDERATAAFPATSDMAKVEPRPVPVWGCRCVPYWVGGVCERGEFSLEQRCPESRKITLCCRGVEVGLGNFLELAESQNTQHIKFETKYIF